MTKLPRINAERLIAALRQDGWFIVRQHGSHCILAHESKPATLSIPMHRGKDFGAGLLHKILKDAGLTPEDFRRLL